jgi:hypothetical protein
MMESQTSQSRGLRLLKGIYDRTRDRAEPIFVAEVAEDAGLSEGESQAAWYYLKEKGLIQTFTLPYTARVNAAGSMRSKTRVVIRIIRAKPSHLSPTTS